MGLTDDHDDDDDDVDDDEEWYIPEDAPPAYIDWDYELHAYGNHPAKSNADLIIALFTERCAAELVAEWLNKQPPKKIAYYVIYEDGDANGPRWTIKGVYPDEMTATQKNEWLDDARTKVDILMAGFLLQKRRMVRRGIRAISNDN